MRTGLRLIDWACRHRDCRPDDVRSAFRPSTPNRDDELRKTLSEQRAPDRPCLPRVREPSRRVSSERGRGHRVRSWTLRGFLLVMPELDQQDLYNAYNFSLENWSRLRGETGASECCDQQHPAEPVAMSEQPQHRRHALLTRSCRLDGSSYPGGALFAKSHYAVNWGGGRQGWGTDFEQNQGTYRGVMMTVGSRSGGRRGGAVRRREGHHRWCLADHPAGREEGQPGLERRRPGRQRVRRGHFAVLRRDGSLGQEGLHGLVSPGLINVGFADGSVRAPFRYDGP